MAEQKNVKNALKYSKTRYSAKTRKTHLFITISIKYVGTQVCLHIRFKNLDHLVFGEDFKVIFLLWMYHLDTY